MNRRGAPVCRGKHREARPEGNVQVLVWVVRSELVSPPEADSSRTRGSILCRGSASLDLYGVIRLYVDLRSLPSGKELLRNDFTYILPCYV